MVGPQTINSGASGWPQLALVLEKRNPGFTRRTEYMQNVERKGERQYFTGF